MALCSDLTLAPGDPFGPADLGPVRLPNRIIKAATFEGMAPRDLVTPELIDFHRAVAAGGVGMTTLAYCAVSPDGQGAPGEIIVRDAAVAGLRDFVDVMHGCGAAASIQLGHAGPVAAGIGRRGLAPSRVFAPQALTFTRAVTEAEIARVTADFARAAALSVRAGFDAVELHFGHGYLVSAFLSPRLNKRTDRWGGSVERRARFAREVAMAVRDAVGDRAAVIAKLNMTDGVPGGLSIEESLQAALLLEADGALDALELAVAVPFRIRCTCSGARLRSASSPRPFPSLCGWASGSPPGGSCRSTPSRKPSFCPTRGGSAPRSRCR